MNKPQDASVTKAPLTRRGFVTAGSGMLFAAAAEACISEGMRSQRGMVRVVLTGLDPAATTGGSARISHARVGTIVTVDVPPIGELVIPADIGQYSVEYFPPAGYILLSGQSDARNIEVDFETTTTVAFSVVAEATVGTVQVNVSGLTGTSPGGTATLQRTDAAQSPIVIPISSTGSGSNNSTPVGTYTITYSAPSGYVDVSVTNPVAGATVVTGTTFTADFAVNVAPGNIHIEVNGLAGASTGGQVSAVQTNNAANVSTLNLGAPVSGRSVGDLAALAAATYSVTYTPPTGFELLPTSPSPRLSTVPPGGTTSLTFTVQQIPGAISVTVTGLTGAQSGGRLSAIRTDNTGPTFTVDLPAPSSGSSSGQLQNIPPGTYNASYTAPLGFAITSLSPQPAAVTSGGTTPVAFTVAAADGTLRLTVVGFDPAGANAGTASMLRTDIPGQTPVPLIIPIAGTLDTTVQPGTYSVTYTAPTAYQLSAGQTNPRSIAVAGTQTAIMPFQVELIPVGGTLRITVTGLDPAGADGGSALVLRTDIPGQASTNVTLPPTGTLDSPVSSGTYRVTYTPPGGRALVSGTVNPQSVFVGSSAVGTVTFGTEVLPPPLGVIFHSDFSTALGTSDAAVLDQGKALPWNLRGGQGHEVISAAGLGFPTANCLRLTALSSTAGFALVRRTGLPIPAVGESRFYRFYFQYTGPDGQIDQGSHPIQDGNAASDTNIMFNIYHDGSQPNTWSFAFWPGNGIQPQAENRRFKLMADLAKGVTYRIEFQVHRISATTFNLHARVFDSAGTTPLYTDQNFRSMDGFGANTLANNPSLIFNNVNNMDGLNGGNNGGPGSNASDYPHLYGYQSGFAVSGSNWIGPYAGGI